MEINIETAVRICPLQCTNGDTICVQANPYNNTIQLGHSHPYPVNYVLQPDCPQNTVFTTSVLPLLNYLLEGCDVSVVTIGQAGMGKSYTLVGPGLSCTLSESEYGVVPRFLRDLFARIAEYRDRNSSVLITWSQICGENVQDLLGAGSVECKSISEAFQYIQIGMSNIAPRYVHTLFTVTLEQQWIFNNTIQHRISTASFADLCGSEKIIIMDNNGVPQSVPSDSGLLNLQRCVMALTEPTNQYNQPIPYNQSVLTTLLKDSFGGRAKTLLICCISPLLRDLSETFYTLQFAIRAQLIKNLVTVNSYTTNEKLQENCDVFGLQFAANQLFKLVSNAEELFQRLVASNSLSKNDLEQVSQWLTLKQECEDCLSETSEPRRSLERIEEEIEDYSDSCESEDENVDIINRLNGYMENFRKATDSMVSKANGVDNHLHSTTKESGNSLNSEFHNKGARGRRTSIHSAEEFSSPALSISHKIDEDTNEDEKSPPSYENKQKMLKQVSADLQGSQKQITELNNTIEMKERLMQKILKHKTIKTNARDKMELKLSHLKMNYEEISAKLEQPANENKMVDKYKQELADIELKINDIDSIKNITEDGSRRVMELESSLHTSKKQLDKLKKLRRKDEKRKLILENELKLLHKKKAVIPESKSLVLPDNWVDVCADVSTTNDKHESLRHEIRNLRRTRELLLEQRCKIDNKSYLKIVNELEERKLIQYEEAVEAIDLAIEYKNELMCGHEDINQKALAAPQDQTDRMLLERLMKLNEHEMRALLYKYFEKVVDLRSNSKKLEIQVVDMDCQNENLTSRVQSLCHTLQQVRFEGERRILSLQQQHEDKLHIVMRHIASDGGDSRVVSHVVERSKQAALNMHGASKHVDKRSIIARISCRALRHETEPATPPQAKVTRQKNKLIITQDKIQLK